jgi:hypothetical protein
MRVIRVGTPYSLLLGFGTLMEEERVERLADRPRLSRIEGRLDTAFNAAKRVHGTRILHANHIYGQLVVLDEMHVRSLSLLRWEISQ